MLKDVVMGAYQLQTPVNLGTDHPLALGTQLAAWGPHTPASAAWPAANRAIFIPFVVPAFCTVSRLFVYNGTVSGNIDMGIYDESGNRIVSKGSTAGAGSSAIQYLDITDTTLAPGRYYLALAVDNATATFLRLTTPGVLFYETWGCAQQGSAFVLPATATLAQIASAYLPLIGLTLRASP